MSEFDVPTRPGEPHPALLRAAVRILKPLVKVFIDQGLTFPALSRLLKEIYVDVAVTDFPVEGKRQTDSRINLLTGLHRKDIKQLRGRGPKPGSASPVVSRNAHMVALWTGATDYVDARGRPKPLPRHRPGDGGVSFESLVNSVSTDIRPRAVLDEWLRLELVRLEGDIVHLNSAAFVPREDFADLAYYFGRNLADHIGTSGHNLLGGEPPLLERAVYYEELTADSVGELADLARELGSDVLVALNKRALELYESDRGKPDAGARITFGVYFFAGDDEPERGEG